MLAADDMMVLGPALTPPTGYQVDAVATATYSLDLVVALGLPLALVRAGELAGREADAVPPVALLEAILRLAKRYRVFCDASAVQPTARREALLLSDVVVPVVIPHTPRSPRRSFHPKFVLVRYLQPGRAKNARMRLACMSRNLTGDTSRDVAVVLDGEVSKRPLADNEPFAAALEKLPNWAVQPRHRAGSAELIAEIAASARRTVWAVPRGFDRVRVWPLGLGTPGHPIEPRVDERRVLVLSPFVRQKRLADFVVAREAVLISNRATLDDLPPAILIGHDVRHPDSIGPDLHAKLYVFEAHRSRRWVIGSANATPAAVERNAELVIELEGGRRAPGIDDLLDDKRGIGATLVKFEPDPDATPSEPAPTAAELAVQALASCRFVARVRRSSGHKYRVEIFVHGDPETASAKFAAGFAGSQQPLDLDRQPSVVFVDVRAARVVPFLVVIAAVDEERHERLVALELDGVDVADLTDDLLADTLNDPASGGPLEYVRQVLLGVLPPVPELRFDDPDGALVDEPDGDAERAGADPAGSMPLLEPMLRALEEPAGLERLDELARVVKSLRTKVGDFAALWDVFEEARRTQ